MAAQKGRDCLVKIGGTDSSTAFVTVGGMTTNRIVINETEVDITAKDTESPHWRGLLAGGGVKSMEISGSGIFKDGTGEGTLMTAASQQASHYWFQFVIPSFRNIEGEFLITSLEYGGDDDGAVNFSATFASAGKPTLTAI
jgi:TP901-1 family phage major tail protein